MLYILACWGLFLTLIWIMKIIRRQKEDDNKELFLVQNDKRCIRQSRVQQNPIIPYSGIL
jgi:hypothetical protein